MIGSGSTRTYLNKIAVAARTGNIKGYVGVNGIGFEPTPVYGASRRKRERYSLELTTDEEARGGTPDRRSPKGTAPGRTPC
jgi:hypothetical protein